MSDQRRWTICANCATVVEIEDEGACDCLLHGETPDRILVMPVSDHRSVVERLEGERDRFVGLYEQTQEQADFYEGQVNQATALIHRAIEEFERRADDLDAQAGLEHTSRPSFAGSFYREAASFLRDQLSSPPENRC